MFDFLNVWIFEMFKKWMFECLNVWLLNLLQQFDFEIFEFVIDWIFECLKKQRKFNYELQTFKNSNIQTFKHSKLEIFNNSKNKFSKIQRFNDWRGCLFASLCSPPPSPPRPDGPITTCLVHRRRPASGLTVPNCWVSRSQGSLEMTSVTIFSWDYLPAGRYMATWLVTRPSKPPCSFYTHWSTARPIDTKEGYSGSWL